MKHPLLHCCALIAVMLIGGCGHKMMPQPITTDGIKPQIINLKHQVEVNVLVLQYTLQGNADGVGIQIDRAEEDPYCHCPGRWQRFRELPPTANKLHHPQRTLIPITGLNRKFLFRVRAIDADGQFSSWSKPIKAEIRQP